MKRSLIPQMLHEWRSNLWLILELTIVSGVVCYLCLFLSNLLSSYFKPLGFEPDNVYSISTRALGQQATLSQDTQAEEEEQANTSDLLTLLNRLRSNPHVEAAAISINASPFKKSYYGNHIRELGRTDTLVYYGNARTASPDLVKILRLTSNSGISPEEMEKRLKNGEIFLSNYADPSSHSIPQEQIPDLVGKHVIANDDSTTYYKVGGLMPIISRTTYEYREGGMILFPLDETKYQYDGFADILIRVKKGEAHAFAEDFKSDPALRKQNNVVLFDLTSMRQAKALIEKNEDIQVRMYIGMIGFFLMIVFLGLLGSFWYRVLQRTPEIALRKAIGANNGDIIRRLLSEGFFLLALGFLSGVALFYIYFYVSIAKQAGKYTPWGDAFTGVIMTCLIMIMIVVAGIFFPARRAISIQPAIALKDE